MLFLIALALTWVASSLLSNSDFGLTDPRTGQPLRVHDQLSLTALTAFLSGMVQAFVTFAPLGMVLVMVIGVGARGTIRVWSAAPCAEYWQSHLPGC